MYNLTSLDKVALKSLLYALINDNVIDAPCLGINTKVIEPCSGFKITKHVPMMVTEIDYMQSIVDKGHVFRVFTTSGKEGYATRFTDVLLTIGDYDLPNQKIPQAAAFAYLNTLGIVSAMDDISLPNPDHGHFNYLKIINNTAYTCLCKINYTVLDNNTFINDSIKILNGG